MVRVSMHILNGHTAIQRKNLKCTPIAVICFLLRNLFAKIQRKWYYFNNHIIVP